MESSRLIIYPKDIQRITGRSERYGRQLITKIKGHLQKAEHQLVSVDEFCTYVGLERAQVLATLVQ